MLTGLLIIFGILFLAYFVKAVQKEERNCVNF